MKMGEFELRSRTRQHRGLNHAASRGATSLGLNEQILKVGLLIKTSVPEPTTTLAQVKCIVGYVDAIW